MKQLKVGIDAGASLIKIAFQEKRRIHYKKYPIGELDDAIMWLKMIAPNLLVALTGGKAHLIKQKYFPDGVSIPEFQATCEGVRLLLFEEGMNMEKPFLVVNIGTGTSWFLIHKEKYERILGSGIGGGTFTGLGSLLTTSKEYEKLTVLANAGEKGNVDLLVKDIYESDVPPIEGNLTAGNFAKAMKVKHSEADRMAAVTNMIVETIVLLTLQAAAIHQTKEVVFIGSALTCNPSLRGGLESFTNKLGLSSTFLRNGEYCGAAGAYFSC
jgi:type II pantothenate kinase